MFKLILCSAPLVYGASVRPIGIPGFPDLEAIVPIGHAKFFVEAHIGSGLKTRTYLASKRTETTAVPAAQGYQPPATSGLVTPRLALPEQVVIKCMSMDARARVNQLEIEYMALTFLNSVDPARKQRALYLSPKWTCIEEPESVCQYLVTTRSSPDIGTLVKGNLLNLKAPVVEGVAPTMSAGLYSFEVFIATFSLALMSELDQIHGYGLAHGDVSTTTVALDFLHNNHVQFSDLSSSKFLHWESEILIADGLVKRDFKRVRIVATQLIEMAIKQRYATTMTPLDCPIYKAITGAQNKSELRGVLLNYLESGQPSIKFEGRVIYTSRA